MLTVSDAWQVLKIDEDRSVLRVVLCFNYSILRSSLDMGRASQFLHLANDL